jgi:hypothetical protein
VEQPLAGGRITSGVVRIGDTVRRRPSAASGFVARLLPALAGRGFTGCPRHLGFDDRGREVLSYVPGEIAPRWRRFDDEQVVTIGQLLRRLHDASRDLAPTAVGYSREFASGYRGPDAVICHHDAGPNNVILHSGQPVALIDFDFAAPGSDATSRTGTGIARGSASTVRRSPRSSRGTVANSPTPGRT